MSRTVRRSSEGCHRGSDIEDIESLRERVLFRKSEPPMGGAKHDYVAWALSVAGVTRAWCLPHADGLGTIGVLFVRDDDDNFIPDAAEVQAVQDYIESVRPVTASSVYVAAPTPVAVDFTLKNITRYRICQGADNNRNISVYPAGSRTGSHALFVQDK